jgi:hypothetical protein
MGREVQLRWNVWHFFGSFDEVSLNLLRLPAPFILETAINLHGSPRISQTKQQTSTIKARKSNNEEVKASPVPSRRK